MPLGCKSMTTTYPNIGVLHFDTFLVRGFEKKQRTSKKSILFSGAYSELGILWLWVWGLGFGAESLYKL